MTLNTASVVQWPEHPHVTQHTARGTIVITSSHGTLKTSPLKYITTIMVNTKTNGNHHELINVHLFGTHRLQHQILRTNSVLIDRSNVDGFSIDLCFVFDEFAI